MRIYIKTYGCQMNERDSDAAAAMLASDGHCIVDSEEDAELIILNTCSVRDQAERKAIGKLGILKRLKEIHPDLRFGIMGCMAQSRGTELLKSIPHLDFAVGTDKIHELPEIVAELARKRKIELPSCSCKQEISSVDSPGVRPSTVLPSMVLRVYSSSSERVTRLQQSETSVLAISSPAPAVSNGERPV